MAIRGWQHLRAVGQGQALASGLAPGTATLTPSGEIRLDLGPDEAAAASLASGAKASRPAQILVIYRTKSDDRVRPEHAALNDTVWRADDPDIPSPPLGFGCRCWLEYVAADEASAQATGLPVIPQDLAKDPPRPGADAMERFFKEAGVDPRDTLGRTVGDLVDRGKINLDRVMTAQGDRISVVEARIEAMSATRQTSNRRLAALARLQGMGLDPQKAATLAREAQKAEDPARWAAEQMRAAKPGLIRTQAQADRAAGLLRQTGLLQKEAWTQTGSLPAGGTPPRPLRTDGRLTPDLITAPKPPAPPDNAPLIPDGAEAVAQTKALAKALVAGKPDRIRQAAMSLVEDLGLPQRKSLPNDGALEVHQGTADRGSWDPRTGVVSLRSDVLDGARRASTYIAEGKVPPISDAHDLRTVVHETVHGTGPLDMTQHYHGAGMQLEEVTTEVWSRRTMRRVLGLPRDDSGLFGLPVGVAHPGRSYDSWIEKAIGRVSKAAGISRGAAADLLEQAAERYRLSPPLAGIDDAVQAFARIVRDLLGDQAPSTLVDQLTKGW